MDDQSSQDQGNGGTQVGQAEPAAGVQTVPLPAPAGPPQAPLESPAGMPAASAAVATPAASVPADDTGAVVDPQLAPPGLPPIVPLQPGTGAPEPGDQYDDSTVTAEIPLPQEAADQDIIEREWIDKVKHVIEKTAHDPYQQVQALNQLRADYMKKRYNKDVIVPEQ